MEMDKSVITAETGKSKTEVIGNIVLCRFKGRYFAYFCMLGWRLCVWIEQLSDSAK